MRRAALLAALSLAACDDAPAGPGGGAPVPTQPAPVRSGELSYTLNESPASLALWTTPVTRRIRTADRAPDARNSGLRLSAARREFEAAQLLLGPAATGSVSAEIAPFPRLGDGQRVTLAAGAYEQGWLDRLAPLGRAGSVTLDASAPAALWLTVYVPEGAPAGDHETTLTLRVGGAAVAVPVRLHVFDFALPREVHFDSQLNLSVQALAEMGGEEAAKTLLFEHRLTPASVTWPSGFRYDITWDNPASTTRCTAFWDEPTEGAAYSIGSLAPKYLLGRGWNGVGFPSAMALTFVDNDTPRPARLCGVDRGTPEGSDAFNAAWSRYLGGLRGYLAQHGMLDRAYYYAQNEPQNADDYRLAAHLCRLTRAAAPGLRLAISEEPKPEIAEDAGGACGWDIWIAALQHYRQDYAWRRQRERGERVWFYSLDQDPDPFFNPTRVDRQGLHFRIIPWVAWHYRATGWAYYDAGRFFDGVRPTVRAELLREGFEDYEYLYLANGGAHPRAGDAATPDPAVDSVASSLTGWTQDPDALTALRHELGRYLGHERTTLPVVVAAPQPGQHPRAAYAINFQDPRGRPTADPLVVGGRTYTKVGWDAYDPARGYGWSGENVGNPAVARYGYDERDGYDERQRSFLYDDNGRPARFEFALENGRYRVTVGVGRPARGYPDDPNNAVVEGVRVVDDVATTDAQPTLTRSASVEVRDGSLTLEVGGRSQRTGDFAYTFVAFLDVAPE
ncbi:MAG: hypothetical protein U0324_21540 [Polyangiales bacterium]